MTPSTRQGNDSHGRLVAAATQTQATTVLAIPGMCCAAEFGMVDSELRRLAAVREVTPDFLRRSVRVQHDALADAELVSAAARSGLEVHLAEAAAQPVRGRAWRGIAVRAMGTSTSPTAGAGGAAPAPDGASVSQRIETPTPQPAPTGLPASWRAHWKLAAGGVLALAAEVLALAFGDHWPGVMALALAAIGLAGLPTYRKGLRALRRFNLNINALMSVAVTGAALLGQWPEAAMVMVLFALAEMIEERSLDRARRAVEGLMAMAPQTATVRDASGWREVPAASVALHALVRVGPGERIALDGQVTQGSSAVDQAAITGESIPLDKGVGDLLFAGSINQDGELQYRVTARANDSTLARIIHAVQEAQASRAPTQRLVDAFARVYTPAVFAAAVAIALVPPLFMGADGFTWVYRALVMLVIACPCALVLSTPVSVVSGLTAAARRGILVKGGLYLEQGHRLEVLALDKTGTLTLGRPAVTDIVALRGTPQQALRLAAALAARSDHPLSKAVVRRARGEIDLPEVAGFAALPGRGIEGDIEGERHRLGNHRLVEASGACSAALEQQLAVLEEQGKTAIVLLRGAQALAIFAMADAVRPESAQAIAELQRLGIRPVMLTGDNPHTAQAIARQVGIAEVRSGLLPEGKLAAIADLSAGGTAVGMVGDGINDAPALARAAVGFAMGAAGSDTAIETADVALMNDDPRKLAEFVRLSRATRAVLWQNITLALGIKVVFLALALAGQATLWMAVFADMGGSLLVVFNGLRLLRQRA